MKSNNNFREQVTLVTSWFRTWSECEQTVALYSLLKKLTPSQAKFLVQVLQQSLADCTEAKLLEDKANDPAYITKVCSESKEMAISHLLKCLPLLQSGNAAAKKEYLRIIPEVLSHAIENGVNIEESRQLLSYSLIHPAISGEERLQFRMWLGYLEERFTYSISPARGPSHSPSSVPTDQSTTGGLSQDTLVNNSVGGQWSSTTSAQDISTTGNAESDNHVSTNSFLGNNFGSHQSLRMSNSHVCMGSAVNNGHIPLHATSSAPPNFNTPAPTNQGNNNQHKLHQPLRRTYSITPPVGALPNPEKAVTDWLRTNDNHLSRANSSSTCEHAPLSPQSSVTSSGSGGSDTHPDDGGPQPVRDSFLEEGSGMREVPVWLKNLRLHKYAYLFRQMTYEEMMNLSEEWLESQSVTKGARHKIILSIAKLRERQDLLRSLEKDIMEKGCIKQAISEMRNILNTPIKSYTPPLTLTTTTSPPSPSTNPGDTDINKIAEGDITGQFMRLMGKVCTQLLVASRPDDECFTTYLQLIDKCLSHEAFTQKQKNLLATWKQQAHKIWQPPPYKYGTERPRKTWGNTFPLFGTSFANRINSKQIRTSPKQGIQQWSFGSKRSVVGAQAAAHMPLQKNNSLNTAFLNKPGLLEGKQQVTRTNSAPIRSGPMSLSVPVNDDGSTDTEINARLDSLCISMTEHALGSLTGENECCSMTEWY